MVIKEYRDNGLKLLQPLVEDQTVTQDRIRDAVGAAKTDLAKTFESMSMTFSNVTTDFQTASVSKIEMKWLEREKRLEKMIEKYLPL